MSLLDDLHNEVDIGEDGELRLLQCYKDEDGDHVRNVVRYDALAGRDEHFHRWEIGRLRTLTMVYRFVQHNDAVIVLYGGAVHERDAPRAITMAIVRGRLAKRPQFAEVPIGEWNTSRRHALRAAARAFGTRGVRIDRGPPPMVCAWCGQRTAGGWDAYCWAWVAAEGCACIGVPPRSLH